MKIIQISYTNSTIFKSYGEDNYDDSYFQSVRNALREHHNRNNLLYHDIYEKEHRLTDYQIQNMINELEKYHEMQRINGTNIYRGQTLEKQPEYLNVLKIEKGIKTIIDLAGYGDSYQKAVENAGLNYYMYNIYDNWWSVEDINNSHKAKLVDFIRKMQEDNIYIACKHGKNDTNIAFILNDFFNPHLEGKEKITMPENYYGFPKKLNAIHDLLTQEDKKLLGWTKEFEQRLIKKLISI